MSIFLDMSGGRIAIPSTWALIVVHSADVNRTFALARMVASSIPGSTYLEHLVRSFGLIKRLPLESRSSDVYWMMAYTW
jgi:hypothetical protein